MTWAFLENGPAADVFANAKVCGENVPFACQRPCVGMVNILDPVENGERAHSFLQVDLLRSSFHQEPCRIAKNTQACPDKDKSENHSEDGINEQKARKFDSQRRYEDQQAADEGLQDVPKRATGVEVAAALFPDEAERYELRQQPTGRGHKHRAGRQVNGCSQPHRGHVNHDERHAEKKSAAYKRAKNL